MFAAHLILAATVALADAQGAGAPPPAGDARVPETFGSSDVRDWYAPDERTLIISTYGHGAFRATFMGRCPGIRFADTLGFRTRGPWELDQSTLVVLPDGRQCAFRDLQKISPEQEKAERKRRRSDAAPSKP